MPLDLTSIHARAAALLAAVAARDALAARGASATLIAALPADDFADPAPGLTVCTIPEYQFRAILPRLRGTARMWSDWLETAEGDWPEPVRLRGLLQVFGGIVGEGNSSDD